MSHFSPFFTLLLSIPLPYLSFFVFPPFSILCGSLNGFRLFLRARVGSDDGKEDSGGEGGGGGGRGSLPFLGTRPKVELEGLCRTRVEGGGGGWRGGGGGGRGDESNGDREAAAEEEEAEKIEVRSRGRESLMNG